MIVAVFEGPELPSRGTHGNLPRRQTDPYLAPMTASMAPVSTSARGRCEMRLRSERCPSLRSHNVRDYGPLPHQAELRIAGAAGRKTPRIDPE